MSSPHDPSVSRAGRKRALWATGPCSQSRLQRVVKLPDAERCVATVRALASAPTIPMHEQRALAAIRTELARIGVTPTTDRWGQLHARVAQGEAKRALVLVAHTDHPGFEVVTASGAAGRVRVRGGLDARLLARGAIPVIVHHDDGRTPARATLDDYVAALELPNASQGHLRIAADAPLEPGMWAVLDLPAFAREGDELRLRAADDLAGCAVVVETLAALAAETRPHDVRVLFTRAEETGLFGARLAAEDGSLPRDAVVVSLEASRELPHVRAGDGPVIRAGDLMNTFSNEAERPLRVAQERLALAGIPSQRALLTGGTCEASVFVRLGWLATGVALPNIGYHNAGAEGFVPETVRLSDVRGAVALLAEAAVAAAEDAVESWWPDNRAVPDEIRRLLDGLRG